MKIEVMFLYEIGFNDLVHFRFIDVEEYQHSYHRRDYTIIQIGNQHFWLWICIEPIHSFVLGIYISEERNMLVAERFIQSLVEKYGRHTQFTLMVVLGMMKHVMY